MHHLASAYEGRKFILEPYAEDKLRTTQSFARSIRVARTKMPFPQLLALTMARGGSASEIFFDPSTLRRPLPHAVRGVFEVKEEKFGCSTLAMTIKMATKPQNTSLVARVVTGGALGENSDDATEGRVVHLSPEVAHLVADDLLQLLPLLYERFARPDEVDHAAWESLAAHFASSPLGSASDTLLEAAMKYLLKSTLALVEEVRTNFERNWKEVDDEVRDAFPTPPPLATLAASQVELVTRCRTSLEENVETGLPWEQFASPSGLVTMWSKPAKPIRGDRRVVSGKASCVIDCPALHALHWYFAVDLREHMRESLEGGDLARVVLERPSQHDLSYAMLKKMPFPLTKRELVTRTLCFTEDGGDLIVLFEPLPESYKVDYGFKPNAVRALSRGILRFSSFPGGDKCSATLIQYADLAGRVPVSVVNRNVVAGALSNLCLMRDTFQRDEEVDADARRKLARAIRTNGQIYEAREDELMARVEGELGNLDDRTFEELESHDRLVNMQMVFIDGQSRGIWRGTTVVDACVEDAAAWELLKTTRADKKTKSKSILESGVFRINDHHQVAHAVHDSPVPTFSPRERVVSNIWKQMDDGSLKVFVESTDFDGQAKVIGGALASCIAANLTAPAAVDEWILRYPAMGELDREYVWFRPMMDTIAQRLLESVSWGLKMRLYTGAGLSTMDLLSDMFMIYTYATTEQQGTALSLAIMVGMCLLGQLFLVWVQAHKGPRRTMLKEMLIVLGGMKPGIDAMRVAGGNERAEHAAVNPDMELTVTRAFELVCESIPGTVLQLVALIKYMQENDGDYSKTALGSIIVSACTTGFTAATISFDFDVNPQRRRDEPSFYGYIPDEAGRRTAIFFCMIMNGALLLLLRCVSTALLLVVDGR
ncbi:hypothetical protein TeGR_g6424 [Tetraparma gracilis]|uniref:Uncharacterized protein n=1 Tax=Tetraparma gracilis TaxID=2962635 RepID=A0ABQ6M843_9STRA|nr:hypothetical protein TeGR_g6424 [Tetraparma gracilis]